MFDDARYESILEAISSSTTLEEIRLRIEQIRELYGVCNMVYHAVHIPNADLKNPILLLTYDPQWISLYLQNDYFNIDPVVKSGRAGFLPVDWQNLDHDSDCARAFFAKAESYGVGRNGISLPIRGANGERAMFTVTSNASEREWNTKRITYLRDFQMIGHYVHHKVLDVSGLRPQELRRKPSMRELQCLSAVSKGRTPKQIAADLQISETAVRLYLHSIRTKLDTLTITQAVCAAINLNIIQP